MFRLSRVSLGPRLLIFGPPGVGKGTYAVRASEDFDIPHIAAGDLIRAEIKSGSQLGRTIKDKVANGELISDDIVLTLVKKHIEPLAAGTKGFLLDGFPRTLPQAEEFVKFAPLDAVIALEQPEAVIVEKVSMRRVCENTACGWTCNLANIDHPCGIKMLPLLPKVEGVCDKCGSRLRQRPDDNEQVVRKRLQTYQLETAPLFQWFQSRDPKLVRTFEVHGGVKEYYPKFKALLETVMSETNTAK
eukprot:TRINITY_DN71790_c0_g1_i1.p1 TRINITY_DN71790_c0_g1~~TRINITY_DN71790_c0_g1_i1.p1  ORF type:complete len:245 (-),score=71.43 TRINITY_DN71790_c0_g1_i1:178-912(-)